MMSSGDGADPADTGCDPEVVIGATRRPAPTPEDRYLSGTAVLDAAGALSALAAILLRVRGSFADDAVVEADRLRVLADGLAEWSPSRAGGPEAGRAGSAVRRREQHWEGLLQVYFRRALEPEAALPPGEPARGRRLRAGHGR